MLVTLVDLQHCVFEPWVLCDASRISRPSPMWVWLILNLIRFLFNSLFDPDFNSFRFIIIDIISIFILHPCMVYPEVSEGKLSL